jgi:cytochrome c-type biogenesis protein CcmF
VHTGIVEDVYLTLVSSPSKGGRITLGVRVNPMMLWLWIGGGVIALGTILALAPRLRRRRGHAPVAERPAAVTGPRRANGRDAVPSEEVRA